jgi:hypothetical protein
MTIAELHQLQLHVAPEDMRSLEHRKEFLGLRHSYVSATRRLLSAHV